jgi:MYXO-CTERM domain-containing protein
MGARSRWRRVLPTATLTAVTFTLAEQQACALFPPIWPVSPPVVVVPPPVVPPPVIVVPPVPPPPFLPPPVVVPPVVPPPVIVVPPTVPPTSPTPEPSTLVAALAGLGAAAGWAVRRRGTQNEPRK